MDLERTSFEPDGLLVFWKPNSFGYTTRLDEAGDYPGYEVEPTDGNTLVVCEEWIESIAGADGTVDADVLHRLDELGEIELNGRFRRTI